MNGVSLRYLRAFIAFDHQQLLKAASSDTPKPVKEMATWEVKEAVVMKVTKPGQSLTDAITAALEAQGKVRRTHNASRLMMRAEARQTVCTQAAILSGCSHSSKTL